MSKANSDTGVGVGRLCEIKAAKPTIGKLFTCVRHSFERWILSEDIGTLAHLRFGTALQSSLSLTSKEIGMVHLASAGLLVGRLL